MKTVTVTWILAIFGAITFLPLMYAQLLMIIKPGSTQAKDLIVGKGQNWRDQTHFRSALAFAWADLTLILPLLLISTLGVFSGQVWAYALWLALGILSIYFSIIFWVFEKAHATCGWLAYYTYIWGFFLYWGIGASIFSLIQLVQ